MNRYRALSPYLKKGDRILDVGAGGGEVVYVLRRCGFDACGIEPDEQYAQHAREVLGVPVRTGFVQDVSFRPGSFDVVTMYHALEHVENPSENSFPASNVILETPFCTSKFQNVEGVVIAPPIIDFIRSLLYFNHTTLETLGRKAGFDPLRTLTSRRRTSLVAQAAPRVTPARIDRRITPRLARDCARIHVVKYYCSSVSLCRAGGAGCAHI